MNPSGIDVALPDSQALKEIMPLTPVFRQSPDKQTRTNLSENVKLSTENVVCSDSGRQLKPASTFSALTAGETEEDPHPGKVKNSNSDLVQSHKIFIHQQNALG